MVATYDGQYDSPWLHDKKSDKMVLNSLKSAYYRLPGTRTTYTRSRWKLLQLILNKYSGGRVLKVS